MFSSLTFLSLLCNCCVTISAATLPLLSSKPSSLTLDTANITSPSSNTSSISSPYIITNTFDVPNTNVQLRCGYRFPRYYLDAWDISSVIVLAQDSVNESLTVGGVHPGDLYPADGHNRQTFEYEVPGYDVEILFHDRENSLWPFDWGNVRDVLKGLRTYMVEGQRRWEVGCRVFRKQAGLLLMIGKAEVRRFGEPQ